MILAALALQTAAAHGGVDCTVHVDLAAGRWTVEARTPSVLAALGLDEGDAPRHHAAVARWLTEGLVLSAGDAACALGPATVIDGPDAIGVTQAVDCGNGAVTLTDHSLKRAGAGEQTLVVASGVPTVLNDTTPSVEVSLARGALDTAQRFLWEGALHLATGYDHILFLLCLLFVAGPTARREGRGIAVRQLARIVSAFTLGHSLTLAAAALEIVVLPSRWVEVSIALSIAIVAAMNVSRPDSPGGHRAWLAFAFGLVHGFGFSAVLSDVGLPLGERVVALLSFNVGIELAQLAVVALAVGPLAWLAIRADVYRRVVMQGASGAIGLVSLVWVVQRVFGA